MLKAALTTLPARAQSVSFSSAGRAVAAPFAQKREEQRKEQWSSFSKGLGATVGAFGAAAVLVSGNEVFANEDHIHSPSQSWGHHGFFSGYDHSSIRRGHQVFAQICASCHGLKLVAFRTLVNVAYTEDEVKAMAEEREFPDDPAENGEPQTRPGKLSDYMKGPYANEQQARYANGGALPPDLSIMTKARPGGEDYLFSLLTGYHEPPAGVTVREGLHYNPYFPGGAIGMAKQLNDGAVDYFDGTPSTASQMAKDVSTFLSWCAEPELNDRHSQGVKWMFALALAIAGSAYFKRFRWSTLKTRRIQYRVN